MKKALVLLSGGQDSTTSLLWAIDQGFACEAIGFDYGQSHSVEMDFARKNCSELGINFEIVELGHLFRNSSLIEGGDHNEKHRLNDELPASFVPGRNIIFLTTAAVYASRKGITDLVTGVCQTDYSGYPDCRRETIDAIQNSLTLGMGLGEFKIHTPLMYLTKAETWKMAKDLGGLDRIINSTMTDYNGNLKLNEWGYGRLDNPASELRAKGYYEAKENGWI